MKKQTLAIIGIIAAGSLFSIVYATGTVITDSGITTPTLTTGSIVNSGSCTGCGASEGSYSSWSTTLNQTVTGSHASLVVNLQINNNGTTTGLDLQKASVINIAGSVVSNIAVSENTQSDQPIISQSVNGEYIVTLGSNNISVFKNDLFFKSYTLTTANFSNMNTVSLAISPNGKYIVAYGEDTGTALERLVVFKGS